MTDYILFAGRLDKTKGIHVLFEAWESIERYDLIVCGIGPEDDWCRSFIKNKGITNIHMLGHKEKNELIPIMKKAKAVILPTQLYEGFPMTIAESLSNGIPVLGSNIGNVDTIIQEGINGLHFQYDSAADIVRAVEGLDKIDWEKVMRVPKEYGPEGNYGLLINIYKKCIEDCKCRRKDQYKNHV